MISFYDWKIAIVVSLVYEEPVEEGGNVVQCKLDVMSMPSLIRS